MVLGGPPIFKHFSPQTKLLGTVSNAPITNSITVTSMFHRFFFSFLGSSKYLPLFSFSSISTLWFSGIQSPLLVSFSFFKTITRYGNLSMIGWYVWIWKLQRYYYYYYSLEFSHQRKLMVFHWRRSDSKSPQVSRTLLSILAVFNNAVVWMVSTRSPTSKSSRPFNNPLVTVPKAPTTIGIIVTFMFHSFF